MCLRQKIDDGWQVNWPLAEVGYFKAKSLSPHGSGQQWQQWPEGSDLQHYAHPELCSRTAQHHLLRVLTRFVSATT